MASLDREMVALIARPEESRLHMKGKVEECTVFSLKSCEVTLTSLLDGA